MWYHYVTSFYSYTCAIDLFVKYNELCLLQEHYRRTLRSKVYVIVQIIVVHLTLETVFNRKTYNVSNYGQFNRNTFNTVDRSLLLLITVWSV